MQEGVQSGKRTAITTTIRKAIYLKLTQLPYHAVMYVTISDIFLLPKSKPTKPSGGVQRRYFIYISHLISFLSFPPPWQPSGASVNISTSLKVPFKTSLSQRSQDKIWKMSTEMTSYLFKTQRLSLKDLQRGTNKPIKANS